MTHVMYYLCLTYVLVLDRPVAFWIPMVITFEHHCTLYKAKRYP